MSAATSAQLRIRTVCCVVLTQVSLLATHSQSLTSPTSKAGAHGALTLVDGRAGCGIVGCIYHTIVRKESYLGHYKVTERGVIPVEIWRTWPLRRKQMIVKEVNESLWGRTYSWRTVSKSMVLPTTLDSTRTMDTSKESRNLICE
jgi:hypothetical protein